MANPVPARGNSVRLAPHKSESFSVHLKRIVLLSTVALLGIAALIVVLPAGAASIGCNPESRYNTPNGHGGFRIVGTSRSDNITGCGTNDDIFGRAGNDVIDGAGGNDSIFGESGNDELNGGSGKDKIDGGKGR